MTARADASRSSAVHPVVAEDAWLGSGGALHSPRVPIRAHATPPRSFRGGVVASRQPQAFVERRRADDPCTPDMPSVPTPDGWADRAADADLSTVEQHSGTVAIVFRFCSFKPECGARQHEVCFSGVPGFLTPPCSVVEVLLGRSHHASLHGSTVSRPSPSKSVVFLVARAAPLVMQIAAIIPSSTASGRPVRRRVSCRSAYRRAAESS